MRRRDLIGGTIGSTVTWPFAARTQQQQPATPIVAYLSSGTSIAGREKLLAGLRKGLAQTGFIEGQNLTLIFRWAGDDYSQLAPMAADLVRQRAAVIVSPNLPSVLAVKGATTAIPIVFLVGDDPIKHGLVASLNHPGGNATGMSMLAVGIAGKRLQLMRELVSDVPLIAILVNPTNLNFTTEVAETWDAARAIGQRIEIFKAENNISEIEAAFTSIAAAGARGLVVGADPFFNSHRMQIVQLAARYSIPGIYEWREFVEQGGLASYGTNQAEAFRELGIYVGRVLKGARPADLPVVQPTTFELVINLRTAKALGLAIPPALLARADEVIE